MWTNKKIQSQKSLSHGEFFSYTHKEVDKTQMYKMQALMPIDLVLGISIQGNSGMCYCYATRFKCTKILSLLGPMARGFILCQLNHCKSEAGNVNLLTPILSKLCDSCFQSKVKVIS